MTAPSVFSSLHTETYGIVLRSYLPLKKSCLVFDRINGVMRGIVAAHGRFSPAHAITHGALLNYRPVSRGGRVFLEDVAIHQVPAPWVTEDILFLHHVLEMSTTFLLEHFPDRSVLDLLLELYRPLPPQVDEALWKAVFLGKLFITMGVYPEDETSIYMGKVLRLISTLGDTRLTNDQCEHWRMVLAEWLKRCLVQHADGNTFKTAHFLN